MDRPDVQGRIRILKVHSRGKAIGKVGPGNPDLPGTNFGPAFARALHLLEPNSHQQARLAVLCSTGADCASVVWLQGVAVQRK